MNVPTQNRVRKVTYFVCQDLFPEGPTEVEGLQHRVAVAGVAELEEQKQKVQDDVDTHDDTSVGSDCDRHKLDAARWQAATGTYVDQSKVVFIHGKLFRSNLLFQG